MATRRRRAGRRTNLALLVLVPVAVVTGLVANTIGTNWPVHPSVVHGVVAVAIALLAPWKTLIVRRGLRRWRRSTWASLVLLATILTTLATGWLHATGFQGDIGPLTLMQVHIGGAVVALGLLVAHFVAHPVRPRRPDLDRRAFVRTTGLTAMATGAWVASEVGMDLVGLAGGRRRFTGSHERGSFAPAAMPVTQWLDDTVQHITADDWVVRIDGRDWTLDDLAAQPVDELTAVLDCTSAWYARQDWSGVRLDRLVEPGGQVAIVVRSATGYSRRFPIRDLGNLWLATHVGRAPLSAGHGFPARIVAPGRRGFWWVKWVTEVELSQRPAWAQLPFPIT